MKNVLFLLMLALPFLSPGQGGKPAKIVFADGNSVSGDIDDKEWLSNPTSIMFRKSGSTTFETYTPNQVKNIQIEGGDRYVGALVNIDNTPDEFEGTVFEQSLISFLEKHVFLLVQFASPTATIYSLRYNNRMHLYYSAPDHPQPRELIYREYTVRKFEGIFKEEEKTYISQLNFLTDNCPDMKPELASLQYSSRDMIKFMSKFHKKCAGESDIYAHSIKQKGKFSFSVIGGIINTNLAFKRSASMTNHIAVVTNSPLKSSTSPAFGGRLGYLIPRGHQKFNLVLDAYYGKVNTSLTEYVYDRGPDDYQIKPLSIDIAYLHSSFGLCYFLTREQDLRPFIQAGIGYSKILSEKSESEREIVNFGPKTFTTESPFPKNSLKNASSYTFLGGGLRYRKLGIEYKFMPMGSLTRFSLISSSMKVHALLLSYKIN